MAKVSFDINNKLVGAAVFAVIVIILQLITLLKVADSTPSNVRSVTATGEATLDASPDEFIFLPNFEFKSTDSATVKEAMVNKGTQVVDGLKELGVPEQAIKLDASQYNYSYFDRNSDTQRAQLNLQITITDRELAQSVQDFLVAQDATGQISPRPTFSEEKQKELQVAAEEQATADARANAERLASGLSAKLGKIIKINPQSSAQPIDIYSLEAADSSRSGSLPIQPGLNEYHYTITVEFELK